jgi:hypothetical protein
MLRFEAWKTTEARLLESENFINVGLEVEPTIVPDRYNAVIRTTARTNSRSDLIFGLLKGAPIKTSYLDFWNLGNSGMNFNSRYRWDANRRRLDGHLKAPIPLPGLLFMDLRQTWRSENWDLSSVIRPEALPRAAFKYKSTGMQIHFKHIPHYRVELGVGFEYINRAAAGNLPELFTDSNNTGRVMLDATLRLAEGTYRNRLQLEALAARESILGDFDYTIGTAELNNRVRLTSDDRTHLDVTLKGGTSRGSLPVEDYFVLGVDINQRNLLRGHATVLDGHYGRAPMGTDFVLANFDIERRIVTLPLFNTLNLPYLGIKTHIFFDGAKTFDRARIFQQGKLLLDIDGGLSFETPNHTFNIVLGRSLRDGTGVITGYVERRLW